MKKLFCVLTVVCMLATLVCVSAFAGPDEHDEQILVATNPTATEAEPTATSAEPVLVGDANGDGVINLKDVLVLRKYLAEMPVEIDLVGADMTRDNTVNMKDVLALRLRIAYEKDAGEDEVAFMMLEDVKIGDPNDTELGREDNAFSAIMAHSFVVRTPGELIYFNEASTEQKMDLEQYNNDYFKEYALLIIPHITDTKIETLAALERLSDDSVYLRYDGSEPAPPWNHVSLQLVQISAQDGAAIKTIVTPRGEQTVSFEITPPCVPTKAPSAE